MPHDAFISHSNAAKLTAFAICNELEASGIRCWILPRDLAAGAGWDQSIAEAVESSRIVILVLTDYSRRSDRIERQLELAFNTGAVVIPFRVESDPVLTETGQTPKSLHWIDAMTPEVALRIRSLRDRVRGIVQGTGKEKLQMTDHQDVHLSDVAPIGISQPQEIAVTADKAPAQTLIRRDSSEEEEPLPIRNNIDKSRIFLALALTLLPFVAVCAIGTWLALHQQRPARPKVIPSTVAAAVRPLPSRTGSPALTTPVIVTPAPVLPVHTSLPTPRPVATASTSAPVISVTPPLAQVTRRLEELTPSDPGWGTPDANWTIRENKIRLTPLPGNGAILVNTAHHLKETEFSCEVVMSKGDDLDQLGGLIFWAKDYNDCYALVVSADGRYAIGRKLFGRWINPTAKTGSDTVKTGAGEVNRLKIRTSEKTFTAFINDIPVATLNGEPPEGEWLIGLYGESGESSENWWDFGKIEVTATSK